jgi:hypothetical protein
MRGEALANHLQTHAHRGVALGTDGLRCLVIHRDPLRSRSDEDRQVLLMSKVLTNDRAQNLFGPCKVDPDTVMTRSKDGPTDLRIGGLVGTHCVNDDVNRHQATITGLKL